MKRSLWLVPLILASSAVLAAVKDADIKQISFDPKTGIAVFEIRNFSNKNVTAFTLAVDIVYADGKINHGEDLLDLSPLIIAKKVDGDLSPGSGAVRPGGTYNETIRGLPVLDGSPLQSINAVLDVVVYDDNSAEVTNKDAFGRVAASRQASANTIARVAAIVRAHVGSNENDPVAAIESDLQTLLSYADSHHEELSTGEITATLRDLRQIPTTTDKRDFLARYSDRKNKRVTESALAAKLEVRP